jgi:TetR/AcrR family transcriptional regulator, ethionamide resistance regulator
MIAVGMSSVTRRRSPHRERRAEASARVLEATESLLRDGERFTELGTERIAGAAGVARSTFYVHFADKADLLVRLASGAIEELFEASDAWWEHSLADGPEPLADALLQMTRIYRRHAAVLDAVAEVAAYDPAVAAFWRERMDGYAASMRARLAEEQAAGAVPDEVDPYATAFVLVWSVERSVAEHVRAQAPRSDAAFATQLARVAWLGIFGRTP